MSYQDLFFVGKILTHMKRNTWYHVEGGLRIETLQPLVPIAKKSENERLTINCKTTESIVENRGDNQRCEVGIGKLRIN